MQEHQNPVLTAVLEDINTGSPEKSKRRHLRQMAENLVLFVAPARAPGEMPPLANFFPVRCRDLSSGGVGFFLPAKPNFERIVVQLGNQQNVIYMDAAVKHIELAPSLPETKEAWDTSGRTYDIGLGSKPYLVGCKFEKRMDGTPK
ncbi:MAG: PilZ domain-containing protein [Planctomycetia bacterium]|jgi:hypothetical protein